MADVNTDLLVAQAFRAAADEATAPERAFREYHREAAKPYTSEIRNDEGNVVGMSSSYCYAIDKEQERDFREARSLARVFGAVADVFEGIAAVERNA
jgi:hypothetical protein